MPGPTGSTDTLCKLLGITRDQLRELERAGVVRRLTEHEWFEELTRRMDEEAAAMPEYADRTDPLTDAEVAALANQTIAKMNAEEERLLLTGHVSVGDLSMLLGVGERRIQQLVERGILPRDDRGVYPLKHCLDCFLNAKRDRLI